MSTLKDILAPSCPDRSAEDIVADLAKNGYVIVGPLPEVDEHQDGCLYAVGASPMAHIISKKRVDDRHRQVTLLRLAIERYVDDQRTTDEPDPTDINALVAIIAPEATMANDTTAHRWARALLASGRVTIKDPS